MTPAMTRALALATAVATAACASSIYVPRADGRITMTTSGGALYRTKNGQRLESGIAALEQAVAGNPTAEQHARAYRRTMTVSLAFNIGGVLATIAGAITLVPPDNPDGSMGDLSNQRAALGSGMLLAGLAAIITGTSYFTSAQAHEWDAINIYNDGLPALAPAPRLTPPPAAALAPPPPRAPVVAPPPVQPIQAP
jgi:hypothetical protein